MRVLGIDLSLSATGLAMIEPVTDSVSCFLDLSGQSKIHSDFVLSNKNLYYHGRLVVPRSTNILTRWDEILLPVLDWAQHAQHIIIEGYSFSNFGAYSRAIGEIGGIVRYHLRKMNHIPIEIAPLSLKKFITGDGRADKLVVVNAIRKLVPSIHDHNMADAFGLAQIGCAIYQAGLELPRHQAELIERIKHPEDKKEIAKRKRVLKFENAKRKAIGVH